LQGKRYWPGKPGVSLSNQTFKPARTCIRMNKTLSPSDIREYVSKHLGDVFDTMLSLKAIPAPDFDLRQFSGERVSGSVGLAGNTVTGSVYLHVSASFALQVTAAMLGLAPEEITGHTEVNDVVAEITNMLGGGLKSWLCDAGATCALTTPAVIRGAAYAISAKPDVELILIGFACPNSRGLVEIHLKIT